MKSRTHNSTIDAFDKIGKLLGSFPQGKRRFNLRSSVRKSNAAQTKQKRGISHHSIAKQIQYGGNVFARFGPIWTTAPKMVFPECWAERYVLKREKFIHGRRHFPRKDAPYCHFAESLHNFGGGKAFERFNRSEVEPYDIRIGTRPENFRLDMRPID